MVQQLVLNLLVNAYVSFNTNNSSAISMHIAQTVLLHEQHKINS